MEISAIDWSLVFSGMQSVAAVAAVIGGAFYLKRHRKIIKTERGFDHSGQILILLNQAEQIIEEAVEYELKPGEEVNILKSIPNDLPQEIENILYRCEVMKLKWYRNKKKIKDLWVEIKIQIIFLGDKKLAKLWEEIYPVYCELFERYLEVQEKIERFNFSSDQNEEYISIIFLK